MVMSETTVLFAQAIVVLAFVYLTAILIGAVIYFILSRKEVYWGNVVFVCGLFTCHVLWWFALPVALEGVYHGLASTSQSVYDCKQ